jgi:hypothetical protein
MTKYLILFINSASSLLLLKTFYSFIFNPKKENKLDFVMSKIKKLEDEINEIHIIVDTLEEKVGILEEKVSLLENNVNYNFLTSNYDMINLSINTH